MKGHRLLMEYMLYQFLAPELKYSATEYELLTVLLGLKVVPLPIRLSIFFACRSCQFAIVTFTTIIVALSYLVVRPHGLVLCKL